jgi:hypothetical protein
MSPQKRDWRMVPVWVWFVGESVWKRMRMREVDIPLIGSPTALIQVESDQHSPTPMPGWRVTQQRPGDQGPTFRAPVTSGGK